MTVSRIRREQENDDGWSDWIHPLRGYRIACCDCGLVHDLEFRIDKNNQLNFRARRNNRSTGQMRRHMPGGSWHPRKGGLNVETQINERPAAPVGVCPNGDEHA